jgi:hypothetical protein
MKKQIIVAALIFLTACNNFQAGDEPPKEDSTIASNPPKKSADTTTTKPPETKTYSNERFRNVVATKTGDHEFLVKGEARVFEAAYSWVVEDGHEELKEGYGMTSAGAPEWGQFSFTVDVEKKRPNSTLHLVLFESSPKDGSRQFELPVLLY